MAGHLSIARRARFSLFPTFWMVGSRIAAFGLFSLALGAGCSQRIEGVVDIDALRQKSIAEGKGDPTIGAPMTPEARKERADRLIKETREKQQAPQKKRWKP